MKWIKKFENLKFKNWFNGSKVINKDGSPRIVYHATNNDFKKFNIKLSTMGNIWFTTNKSAAEKNEVGASGNSYIKEMFVSLKNPAGWEEYEKYSLEELQNLGYDGAILYDDDSNYDGFVFNSNQIKIIK